MICCLITLTSLLSLYPVLNATHFAEIRAQEKQLVRRLGLTDLCLFTEARYTRHLSQADLFSAFQSHPMAFEHFPSGSLTLPPMMLGK